MDSVTDSTLWASFLTIMAVWLAARDYPPALDLRPEPGVRRDRAAGERRATAVSQADDPDDVLVGRPVDQELGPTDYRHGATDVDSVGRARVGNRLDPIDRGSELLLDHDLDPLA